MYELEEYRYDWSNVIKKTIVVTLILIVLLICSFLILNTTKKNQPNSYFDDNLNTMVNVAKNFFQADNDTDNITLKEMLDNKMVLNFIDEDGNTCDIKRSYAHYTNNKIKVHLKCNKEEKTKEINL